MMVALRSSSKKARKRNLQIISSKKSPWSLMVLELNKFGVA
jgi:hypothetical protein